VKLTIYLTDLASFAAVNEHMTRAFREPFPARATVGVKELPRGAAIEVDAVLYVPL
jgi:enamine deaminase RidA (YjgF/YER057c/UK114 family)